MARRRVDNPNHPLMKWAKANGIDSLSALSVRLGVSQPRLSQVISRKHRPAADLAIKIIRETGLEYEVLIELTPAEVRAGVVAGWSNRPRKRTTK